MTQRKLGREACAGLCARPAAPSKPTGLWGFSGLLAPRCPPPMP